MFRSKRSSLVKRLWKHRVGQHHETGSETESAEDVELKSVGQSLLKRLKETEMEALLAAVDTQGVENTPCVMLSHSVLQLGRRKLPPHVLCCQLWRWNDLDSSRDVMRHLPCRSQESDGNSVCCNPFHWSRVVLPDVLVPEMKSLLLLPDGLQGNKQTLSELDALRPNHLQPSGMTSTETGSCSPLRLLDDGQRPFWCHVAYWEHRNRVGRLFTVYDPSVHIFQHLPQGDGMCLDLLQTPSDQDSVRRTRDKIGLGLVLGQEADGAVWAYNRSDFPIFVNSPTLDLPGSPALIVKKVPPGYAIKIYDRHVSKVIERTRDPAFLDGPFDPNAVRISFAKGWGPHYSRQFITSCPCWVEILLRVNR